ncbi:MAG: hypothetical protein A3J63_01795 [Candidatus Moranbacteria bacterium RIFCSPHIGHO2_02_FULL_40_12b]|nr:MAG: hypothetical protein A3J63_01795 [Candidatus Moranbacteria bacterium RIFCSPHIGHO2_02_FULL_40_12b]OGI23460.1 MAG: hypothetical protein A3E91_01585 [Candidatus Moranbacteria bacterium RIFCSPHIGHO2_12_FULL_40_10]
MKTQIFIFGASTEWGAWDLEKGGWPERLKLFLFKKENSSSDFEADFYNLSISGNTSRDILARFKNELKHRIDKNYKKVLIFAVGTNDASIYKKRSRVPISEFKKNLNGLIKEAKKISLNIYFKGLMGADENRTLPVSWNKDAFYYNKSIIKYDEALREICQENKARYINVGDVIGKNDLYDGLHPNSKGHEKIYKTVKNYLLKNKLI